MISTFRDEHTDYAASDSDNALPLPNRYIGTLRRPHPDFAGDCQGRDAEAADIFTANPPTEPGFIVHRMWGEK